MQNAENLNPDQIRQFLELNEGVEFVGQSRAEIYAFTERGSVCRYRSKMTGLSLPQVARLIAKYRKSGKVEAESYRRHSFAAQYTDGDIALLAEVDRAHERLSGPATRRILERECQEFGKQDFQRLAGISVSHLYNLRRSLRYRRQAAVFELTRPTPVSIAERRKPDPRGRPGFLRIDTVHQGDWDGAKGVYHINAVDAVTQWQVVGCASKISEQYLIPVLEAVLHQFLGRPAAIGAIGRAGACARPASAPRVGESAARSS